jgi:GT2 family glycosyltransferase
LRLCLQALRASRVPACEVIVVDDASVDASPRAATELGARLVRLSHARGPAVARNAGARVARGDVVVFVDTDVCVRPDALQRMQRDFDDDPALGAVFGSYQERAGADNFISHYKNFQHHFVHQHSRPDAWTFWSGCGAVRRKIFLAQGGFSKSYRRPAVEDIEFGMRLFHAGGKLKLDGKIQAVHLKRWSLLGLLRAEIMGRAAPWTELLLRHHTLPDDLNLHWSQRASVALAVLSVAAILGGCSRLGASFVAPFAAGVCLSLASYWADSVKHGRGTGATLSAVLLLAPAAFHAGSLAMVPAVALAYALVFIRTHNPTSSPWTRWGGDQLLGLYVVGVAAFVVLHAAAHWLAGATMALVALIVWLNRDFYRFVSERWGRLNTVSAVPFHFSYYLCSALGVAVGVLKHVAPRHGPSKQPAF